MAQDDGDRAREHFAAAASYYESGDYQDALREFRRAYELSERPELFYNFALCYQQLGEHEQAAQYLELYLAQTEDVPNRDGLERRLANLRRRAAGEAADEEPDQEPMLVIQPSAEEDGEDDESEGNSLMTPLTVVGVVSLGAGALMTAIAGSLALAERNRLDNDECSAVRDCDTATLRRRARTANVGLGIASLGGAALVVGIILGVMGGDNEDEPQGVAWAPYVGPEGAGLVLDATF